MRRKLALLLQAAARGVHANAGTDTAAVLSFAYTQLLRLEREGDREAGQVLRPSAWLCLPDRARVCDNLWS